MLYPLCAICQPAQFSNIIPEPNLALTATSIIQTVAKSRSALRRLTNCAQHIYLPLPVCCSCVPTRSMLQIVHTLHSSVKSCSVWNFETKFISKLCSEVSLRRHMNTSDLFQRCDKIEGETVLKQFAINVDVFQQINHDNCYYVCVPQAQNTLNDVQNSPIFPVLCQW